ncbi:monovalent cation/H+ antiporter complex subunit F [Rhodococcus antarcticus]|uniref:Monovalent cation/H+ antiporter complex subunit F n=1 Tax=Rhodococcus antarcticus TaxID=2987751 RepID=A0ABY6NY87_9NOCA|nr:monovalent cation/H+ antiporter complex subunit F [Rhodococcus antarcticus]UZJ24355.1 monovalent cation/H+ antiporter complex subunit F [Rhodococcus antarcticus]
MTVIYGVSGVCLLLAATLTMVRMLRGPSSLDRVVAVDVLVAIAIGGMVTYSAATGSSSLVPAIVALTLLAFVGSVSVARFRVRDET